MSESSKEEKRPLSLLKRTLLYLGSLAVGGVVFSASAWYTIHGLESISQKNTESPEEAKKRCDDLLNEERSRFPGNEGGYWPKGWTAVEGSNSIPNFDGMVQNANLLESRLTERLGIAYLELSNQNNYIISQNQLILDNLTGLFSNQAALNSNQFMIMNYLHPIKLKNSTRLRR